MVADYRHCWKTVVFTLPSPVEDEAKKITLLLSSGAADCVHIRKPEATPLDLARLIADIPAQLHHRLRIHDCFELSAIFPLLGGVHLNSRNPEAPTNISVSKSCHSVEELAVAEDYEYVTLSPVYNSISKPGYNAAFSLDDLSKLLQGYDNVIALGGVKPHNFRELHNAGFAGAALLGYVWENFDNAVAQLLKQKALMQHFALQFITNGADVADTVNQVRQALEGGCRWVQVRMKDSEAEAAELAATACLSMCKAFGATLLVDDNVQIAKRLGIGVHLGKNDMPASEARRILGDNAIIGSTCNSADDMDKIVSQGASDYIGLGPYRFTTTKKNLAPVLGLEGYKTLLANPRLHTLPVVAIGGITPEDVVPILQAGADGIAVSGVIANAANPSKATAGLINEINKTLI